MPSGFYNDFLFDYPTWTVANEGDPDNISLAVSVDGGRVIFLQFTDDDLAQRFLDRAVWVNAKPVKVACREELIEMIRSVLHCCDATHIGVDVPQPNQPIGNTQFYRVEDVIAHLEQQR